MVHTKMPCFLRRFGRGVVKAIRLLVVSLRVGMGEAKLSGCSKTVLALNFSNSGFRTRSYEPCGIVTEQHDKIHNKFVQSDNSITKRVY